MISEESVSCRFLYLKPSPPASCSPFKIKSKFYTHINETQLITDDILGLLAKELALVLANVLPGVSASSVADSLLLARELAPNRSLPIRSIFSLLETFTVKVSLLASSSFSKAATTCFLNLLLFASRI